MPDLLKESYEQIPYDSTPRHQTHPDTMATVATMLGLTPPPVETCSVLELGCATGGNLLPMALSFPRARFVGIDLSPRQIEIAAAAARATGANNIQFLPRSITDITPDFGQFDYIICHGVYTWVPVFVRDRILEICRDNLSPNGVAYISYNTFPGWHGRGMVREMMQYHARNAPSPLEKVQQARAFLDLLGQHAIKSDTGYVSIVAEEMELVKKEQDYYIAHEYFEDSNNPLYFHQFARQLADHSLQYLGESPLSGGAYGQLASNLRPFLSNFPSDPLEQEQYFDFARNRTFRRSLVVHAAMPVRAPSPDPIQNLHVEGLAKADSPQPKLYDSSEERFRIAEGVSMTASNPIVKTTLKTLHELWPSHIPFPDLKHRIATRLRENNVPYQSQALDEHLAPLLLQCYLGSVVDLHTTSPRFTREIRENPVVFPIARLQARTSRLMSNLRHRTIELPELDRLVVTHLDGSRTRSQLLELLQKHVPAAASPEAALDESLHHIAQSALLVG